MPPTMHAYFRLCARYNEWANRQLHGACAKLPEEAYRAPRRIRFGSIHGVLNHVLVVERLWLARVQGYEAGITALDEELHEDFELLRDAQTAEDVLLSEYVHGLSEQDLARPIAWHSLSGQAHANAQHELLAHLFDEQARHRGTIAALLQQAGAEYADLGLIHFLHQAGHPPLRA